MIVHVLMNDRKFVYASVNRGDVVKQQIALIAPTLPTPEEIEIKRLIDEEARAFVEQFRHLLKRQEHHYVSDDLFEAFVHGFVCAIFEERKLTSNPFLDRKGAAKQFLDTFFHTDQIDIDFDSLKQYPCVKSRIGSIPNEIIEIEVEGI